MFHKLPTKPYVVPIPAAEQATTTLKQPEPVKETGPRSYVLVWHGSSITLPKYEYNDSLAKATTPSRYQASPTKYK